MLELELKPELCAVLTYRKNFSQYFSTCLWCLIAPSNSFLYSTLEQARWRSCRSRKMSFSVVFAYAFTVFVVCSRSHKSFNFSKLFPCWEVRGLFAEPWEFEGSSSVTISASRSASIAYVVRLFTIMAAFSSACVDGQFKEFLLAEAHRVLFVCYFLPVSTLMNVFVYLLCSLWFIYELRSFFVNYSIPILASCNIILEKNCLFYLNCYKLNLTTPRVDHAWSWDLNFLKWWIKKFKSLNVEWKSWGLA